ncbi:hypothetical protein XA68_11097 [Ophiocordyceps unilateralis]|uniref:Major facilitator superfamily (MFS) profile domain-containing protein n=1 Tax=Ophiocordyceps unilateralis TaxID=268505 RepID=A0A2A9PFT4_OPHUN|nr:hypothetical protein XA68_11097 [Ophiocordyceps unilateralis]
MSDIHEPLLPPAPPGIGPVANDSRPSDHDDDQTERWNRPRGNIAKLAFASLSFALVGMNDASIGALIPYLEDYYGISYAYVSIIFLTPFVGYSVAAFTNAFVHQRLGQRGIAVVAPLCHVATYLVLANHPPYPVLVAANAISGFGNGLVDACFCAWVGVMHRGNSIQGLMHACYSLGALLSPLLATSMVIKAELPWYTFYYVMISVALVELVGLSFCFWDKSGAVYRAQHASEHGESQGSTSEALKSPVTWLCAFFFFTYMGAEVGLGGWIVTFMLRVRHASPFAAGLSGSGFWAGMALGRASLGFVTERFGERLCLTVYLVICIALELVFWLVPRFIVSAIAVILLGFFLGPMFPGGVMVTAKLLPRRIHVSAIGFAMAMGGSGGTVFPFIIGAIAASQGVRVLQPIVLALIVLNLILWLSFPRINRRG